MLIVMLLIMMLIMMLIYSIDVDAAADNPAVADNGGVTTSKLVNKEQLLESLVTKTMLMLLLMLVRMQSFDADLWCLCRLLVLMLIHSDRLAAKLARKESLSTKLEQRPGRQELIDRNILYQVRFI